MFVTGRLVVLVLCGVVPVLLRPAATTVWLWVLVCLVALGLDVLLAGSTKAVHLERVPSPQVRLGDAGSTTLLATNTGRRTFRGSLRDAWQPMRRAGAVSGSDEPVVPAARRR